jgi:hypothetical protein
MDPRFRPPGRAGAGPPPSHPDTMTAGQQAECRDRIGPLPAAFNRPSYHAVHETRSTGEPHGR